ncbi:MAG: LysR substrate-binding domain-containing protein [Myxococcota bacterium]
MNVRKTVAELTRLLATSEFDPGLLSTDLRFVTDDWLGVTVLPDIVARIASLAPRVDLDVLPRGAPGRKALLRSGAVDLALGQFSGAGMDLHRQHLFDDEWVTVLRDGHAALGSQLTPEGWAALTHVIVAPTGGRKGEVDLRLQEEGLVRRVAYAVPHFHTALALVAATDFVLTVPRTMLTRWRGLVAVDPPLALPPIAISMCWHNRTHHDPVQQWVREVVEGVAGDRADRSPVDGGARQRT